MFKGTPDYVLTYFKCWAGKDANEGEAGFATLKGMQSLAMNAEVSGSKAVDGFCHQHQFKGQSSDGARISLVTDHVSDFDAVALAELRCGQGGPRGERTNVTPSCAAVALPETS
jgi:hypothetical protein